MAEAAVMLPAALAERVEHLLGERIRSAPAAIGGHSNLVFIHGDVVVKAASHRQKRADVAREIALLRAVDGLGCSAPSVLASSVDDEWSVLVTIRTDGVPGPAMLADLVGAPSRAAAFGAGLGRILRSVHQAAPMPITSPDVHRPWLINEAAGIIADLEIPSATLELLQPALEHRVHHRGVALLHGDVGLHNVVFQRSSTLRVAALVDWELGGWGNPLADLAWARWTLWFRGLMGAAWPALVETYGPWALRAMAADDSSMRACVLAQMGILLARTDSGTAVRDVWLERISAVPEMPELTLP